LRYASKSGLSAGAVRPHSAPRTNRSIVLVVGVAAGVDQPEQAQRGERLLDDVHGRVDGLRNRSDANRRRKAWELPDA
jgi:hypothetical protein